MSLAFLFAFPVLGVAPSTLERWDLRYPTLPDLGRIVFTQGVFVGLPSAGAGPPFVSTDGLNWSHATVHGEGWVARFSDVADGNGRTFGVTSAGQVMVSDDATNWTALSISPVAEFDTTGVEIAAGNGLLVTSSALGGVAVSQDGYTWSNPQVLDACPRRLWFGHGQFLALLACDPDEVGALWTSADGLMWNPPTDPLARVVRDVSFSEGTFTAVTGDQGLITSTDASEWVLQGWVPLGIQPSPTFFVLGGGVFVGMGIRPGDQAIVLSSPDGINWSPPFSAQQAKDLAFGNGRFVIVGRDTLISNDGVNWHNKAADSGALPSSVAFGDGRFVAVGGNAILSSSNGVEWATVIGPGTSHLPVGVYYAGGIFLGPSWPDFDSASGHELAGYICLSLDGLNWTEYAGPPLVSSLRSIVYGNNTFVAIGQGNRLYASSDGVEWSETLETEFLSNVVFANGMFLASAHVESAPGTYNSYIFGSTDGNTWTQLSTVYGRLAMLATYGNGMFVAQTLDSPNRYILTSSDGVNWVLAYTGPNSGLATPSYAAYASGYFVIVSPYTVLSSPDGVSWTEQPADSALPLAEAALHPALAFGRGAFVAVVRGNIQQSSAILPPYTVTVAPQPSLSSGIPSSALGFTFTRAGDPEIGSPLRVYFGLAGTAQNGIDYVEVPASVVIPAGGRTTTLAITPLLNPDTPPGQTIVLSLLPGEGYTVAAAASATVVLAQAMSPPQFVVPVSLDSSIGSLGLTVRSEPGASLLLEESTDLIAWTAVTNVLSPAGLLELKQSISSAVKGYFYRVRSAAPP